MSSHALQVDEDPVFEKRLRVAQGAGWVVLGLIVIGALCGLFGDGVLSRARAVSPTWELRYERFGRRGDAAIVEIAIPESPGRTFQVHIGSSIIDGAAI